jgi:putative Mg2+ transporter-C (MgtC) family protein
MKYEIFRVMDNEILLRFLLAVTWGGIVGIERELRSKSAGFRTMIMISLGSCFFTILSGYIGGLSNPDRIASNIVTGIGFLGAGVIFRGENRVNGITTAATIWAVAAVGMGIGSGYYLASACASLMILLVLAALPLIESLIDRLNQFKEYRIETDYSDNKMKQYEQLIKDCKLRLRDHKQAKSANTISITMQVHGHAANHQRFINIMMNDRLVNRFEYW